MCFELFLYVFWSICIWVLCLQTSQQSSSVLMAEIKPYCEFGIGLGADCKACVTALT